MSRKPGWERHWLRPKWYYAATGSFMIGSPYPGSFVPQEPEESVPNCVVCRVPLPDERFRLPPGMMCIKHGDEWHAAHPRSTWKRIWDRLDGPIDSLYWWYARRHGEQVPR